MHGRKLLQSLRERMMQLADSDREPQFEVHHKSNPDAITWRSRSAVRDSSRATSPGSKLQSFVTWSQSLPPTHASTSPAILGSANVSVRVCTTTTYVSPWRVLSQPHVFETQLLES